jgi:4-hydroxy-2-oxoheptanedioate aldolase
LIAVSPAPITFLLDDRRAMPAGMLFDLITMAARRRDFKTSAASRRAFQYRARSAPPPAMRPNRLRELWSAGQSAVNGWLAIPSGFAAETMAHQGWDSVTVDLQHGMIDTAAAIDMLTAISTTAAVPLARVPWLEPGIIMKMLDAGAYGVICPMVSSVDEAARFVSCTRYAPRGTRSFGPARALLYAGEDYPRYADATVVRFAMIETAAALDALDAILAVDGLDAIYVGPSDLSLALGCRPVLDDVDAPVAQAIEHIAVRARAHGVIAGIHNGSAAATRQRLAMGFRFVSIASDARLMAAAAQQALAEVRR